ncbi:hypothetical protein FRC10_010373 [Ceratobasidium sp. 414]|nr:hypothetical protein FRC10_010373 [Ceratobasidium sp. 414]
MSERADTGDKFEFSAPAQMWLFQVAQFHISYRKLVKRDGFQLFQLTKRRAFICHVSIEPNTIALFRPTTSTDSCSMDEARAELLKIPPVTRFIIVTSVVISLPVMMHLISGTWFVYAPVYVFGKMQASSVWRLVTSWLLGPPGLAYIFDVIMLHRASTELEETVFGGHSADYAWHLIVSGAAIMALNVPLRTLVFWRPLILFVVYRASKHNPDGQVSLFGLVNIKNLYFPFVLLIFDLISGGPPALVQSLTGVLISHGWFLLFPEPGLLRSAPSTSSSSSSGVRTFGGSSTFTLSGGGRPTALPTGGATGWRKWAVAPWWVRWIVGGMHELPEGGSEGRSWGTAGVAPRGGGAGAAPSGGYKWGAGQKLGSE